MTSATNRTPGLPVLSQPLPALPTPPQPALGPNIGVGGVPTQMPLGARDAVDAAQISPDSPTQRPRREKSQRGRATEKAEAAAPIDAQKIDAFLKKKKSPLAGEGDAFVRAGERYGIDPRLLVAISGIESSFGQNNFKKNNAWGWGSESFSSFEKGIFTVAKGLAKGYVRDGRTSVEEIAKRYCPVGASNDPNGTNNQWPGAVTHFMRELGGNPNDVRIGGKPEKRGAA